jgi:hypothetical protein
VLNWFGWLNLKGYLKGGYPSVSRQSGTRSASQPGNDQQCIAIAIERLERSQNARAEQQSRQDEKNGRWNRRTAIAVFIYTALTLAIVVLSAGSTWFSYKSAVASQGAALQAHRQADIAQDALVASSRPWIKVTDAHLVGIQIINAEMFISIEVDIENIGHSPATQTYPAIVKAITSDHTLPNAQDACAEGLLDLPMETVEKPQLWIGFGIYISSGNRFQTQHHRGSQKTAFAVH